MFDKLYVYNAFCTYVVDGDTIDCTVDLGFSIRYNIRVRLRGINAPEIHGNKSKDITEKSNGLKVKQYLEELILNKHITIKTHKDLKEKFGRYLCDVYLLNETYVLVNQLLKEYCKKNFDIDITYMES